MFTFCYLNMYLTNKTKVFTSIIGQNVVPLQREHNKV